MNIKCRNIKFKEYEMEIGKEIKQSAFSSEYHKLSVNLMFTGSWLHLKNNTYLKPYGLTIQQYNILRILQGQHPNPATINLLMDRMLDKTSNASRLVEKLRRKQLVKRNICEKDRRSVDVVITREGIAVLKKIDAHNEEWEGILKNLLPEEATQLNSLLDKLRG
jgi:DNA-binding MarR family transcriptional regulator